MTDIFSILQTNSTLFLVVMSLFGLVVGSLLNVVIYRYPLMMFQSWQEECENFLKEQAHPSIPEKPFNLFLPRSHCQHCRKRLAIWHNIPVLSYLFLKGHCYYCQHAISWRYPGIECLCVIATVITAITFGATLNCLAALLLTWGLICMAFIDIDYQLLPDGLTLSLLWLGLLFNLDHVFVPLADGVLGAVAGYTSLWLVTLLYKSLTQKDGMAHGDFKLFAMFGAWLGWQALPFILIASATLGAIMGILFILFRRHQWSSPMPFGPYLAIVGWCVLIWGPPPLF